jgi:hypothetical protein
LNRGIKGELVLIKESSSIVGSKDIDGTPGQELEELAGKLYTGARVDAINELRPIVKKHFQQFASNIKKYIISALIASLNGTQFWGGGFPETVADILVEIGRSTVPDLVKALKHRERGVRFGVTLALYNMSKRYPGSLKDVSINDLFLNPEPYIRLNPYDRIVSSYSKKAFNYWEISMALLEGLEIKEVLAGPRLGLTDREFNFETIETYDSIDDLVWLKLSSGIKSFKEAGRSLIITTEDDRNLVIKFLIDRPGLDIESKRPENLENDARWTDYLRQNNPALSLKSYLPELLVFNNSRYIFAVRKMRLKGEHLTYLSKVHLDPDTKYYAISYLPADSYLIYLNDKELGEKEFHQAALVNIRDLAHLASHGIVHSEPINLYHNIGQRQKYNILISGGPGRVDKWLRSTEYPNMRLSGIADFEHLLAIDSIDGLHQAISNELFAWVLVIASYYRIKCQPERDGKKLFGSSVQSLLKEGFNLYYSIFTGNPSSELDRCVDWEKVAGEMTDYMMIDRWKHDRINPDLGRYNGKFPINTLVRALYITATHSILNKTTGPINFPKSFL